MTKQYVILDLDGCISDDRWRLFMIDKGLVGDEKYAAYHSHCGRDPFVNSHIVEHAKLLAHKGGGCLLIVTGRGELYRDATSTWLVKNGLMSFALLMRPEGNVMEAPELKVNLILNFFAGNLNLIHIAHAYDDRQDVLDAYSDHFAVPLHKLTRVTLPKNSAPNSVLAGFAKNSLSPAEILQQAEQTFRERNTQYKDNFRMVGPIMKTFFPDGVPAEMLAHDAFHLFELIVVKLSRLAISKFQHSDSVHDAMVYCAIIESIIINKDKI